MAPSHSVSLHVDCAADAAYMRFNNAPVASTVEFSHNVMVDKDRDGLTVGLEILGLSASVAFDQIATAHGIEPEVFAVLMQELRSSTTAGAVASAAGGPRSHDRVLTG